MFHESDELKNLLEEVTEVKAQFDELKDIKTRCVR